jgi:hypothetical protein
MNPAKGGVLECDRHIGGAAGSTHSKAEAVSTTSEREGARMEEGSGVVVLRDVAPTEGSYQVTVPFDGEGRLSIALQPKRFCFEEPERRPFAYAPSHVVEVDVAAACGG